VVIIAYSRHKIVALFVERSLSVLRNYLLFCPRHRLYSNKITAVVSFAYKTRRVGKRSGTFADYAGKAAIT